ncbi:hypothetical protein MHI43_13100 [Paenibacillus sp. FSL H8-0457]|uniref:hypothetical protein n=1 Tax=unclassified Paenibacillus TaxID=185978 RepID=UPI0003E279B2|nr:hypothetical protein [Paenibacillus sp. FSL H8-457]ETT62523.1 hypothetical protein C172_18886 [Paenibacillus sp. FSL H8-457]
MEVHKSISNNEILKEFKNIMGVSLMNNAANTCNIEQHISVASVLWPEIVEVNDYIFISEFYNNNIENLEVQFNKNRKQIEQFVNSWSLYDFFFLSVNESINNEKILMEFGNILKFFWELRLKELYKEREVVVEIGNNIMGENGMTITLYQA